ncbi:MAG: hypothetical protein PSX36_08690 [bacterium]|nr:hypothetical protein [bacterium]
MFSVLLVPNFQWLAQEIILIWFSNLKVELQKQKISFWRCGIFLIQSFLKGFHVQDDYGITEKGGAAVDFDPAFTGECPEGNYARNLPLCVAISIVGPKRVLLPMSI